MNYQSRRTSRINFEKRIYLENIDNLNQDGIYMFFSDNSDNIIALIIGPSETVYHNGCYFLEFNFPNKYPFDPPKVRFGSLSTEVRIHPNLYTCGYVCLSLINTWGNDEYSPSINITKILRTIQSILTDNPIEGEPGHENDKSNNAKDYRELVKFYNIKLYFLEILKNPPVPAEFKEEISSILRKHFLNNYQMIWNLVKTESEKPMKLYSCSSYGLNGEPDYKKLLQKLEDNYKNLTKNPSPKNSVYANSK